MRRPGDPRNDRTSRGPGGGDPRQDSTGRGGPGGGNRRDDRGRGRPNGGDQRQDARGGGQGGGNRRQEGSGRGRPPDSKQPPNRMPDRLDELPYMTPTMIAQLRRAGVHSPSDMRGQTGDQIYAALQKSYGEQPHHTVVYVLRAIVHFVRTGERKDWREFMDVGHKRRPPERGGRPPGPFGTHPRSGDRGKRPPQRPPQ